ncbi:MAG: TetR/AcrR family transcriptional regulator [Caulobacteraceae bacterium]|nr:TetR/AcrR family transcriptional regulator [Caulobacteraceae bacterium]
MIKSDDRRAAILGRLADHVLAAGLSASSLRPLAKAARISDRMLLYYFKDKAEVIAATLEVVSRRLVAVLDEQAAKAPLPLDELRAELIAILLADGLWPYMRLWLEIASLAARGDSFYRGVGEAIARGFLAWGEAQLDSATPQAREAEAAKLLIMVEGMVLLKSVGLDDVCQKAL